MQLRLTFCAKQPLSTERTHVTQTEIDSKPRDFERFWFKVFNDIRTDMRFLTMSYEHQGIYVNLLALANTTHSLTRIVAPRTDLAHILNISPNRLEKALAEFERKSLLFVEGQTIEIADERHYTGVGLNPSDAREAKNERVRKSRQKTRDAERQRAEAAACSSNMKPAREDQSSGEQNSLDQSEEDYFKDQAYKERMVYEDLYDDEIGRPLAATDPNEVELL